MGRREERSVTGWRKCVAAGEVAQLVFDTWRRDNENAGGPRPYAAGTWGPAAASALVARDGYAWSEEQ